MTLIFKLRLGRLMLSHGPSGTTLPISSKISTSTWLIHRQEAVKEITLAATNQGFFPRLHSRSPSPSRQGARSVTPHNPTTSYYIGSISHREQTIGGGLKCAHSHSFVQWSRWCRLECKNRRNMVVRQRLYTIISPSSLTWMMDASIESRPEAIPSAYHKVSTFDDFLSIILFLSRRKTVPLCMSWPASQAFAPILEDHAIDTPSGVVNTLVVINTHTSCLPCCVIDCKRRESIYGSDITLMAFQISNCCTISRPSLNLSIWKGSLVELRASPCSL